MQVLTHSGLLVDLHEPEPEMFLITDIAHSLAHQCRFNGHTNVFYSVAQHSVECSKFVKSPEAQYLALMHDAAEAYTGDIIRPLKELVPVIEEVERNLQTAIFQKFRVPTSPELWAEVDSADNFMLDLELRTLLQRHDDNFYAKIAFTPEKAKSEFLNRFYEMETKLRLI